MKNRLAAALLVLACLRCPAQKPWTLDECINYARTHNLTLKQAAINNEINKNNTDQSKAQILPTINLGASHTYNFGKTIDRFTNTFANTEVLSQNFFLSSNFVIWSGLSQYNNIKANEYNYLSGVERLKQLEYDLSLDVANAYINVIFTDELIRISQNQYDITNEQLDRTAKMVTAGALARSVEYDIKAQLANEQVNLTTAQNNYQVALLTLRQLMNLDSISNFSVEREDIAISGDLPADNTANIYEKSLTTQPIIKSGEYNMLSAERALAAARGRRSPTLSLTAGLGTGTSGLARDFYNYRVVPRPGGITGRGDTVYIPVTEYDSRKTSFIDQFNNNVNQSVGFTLTIPLFNGLQTHTAVKNAKLSAWNAKVSQDLNKQNLFKSIAQAHLNSKAALNKYNASRLSVEAAAESFKYAQQKFNAGTISSFDFNNAKNRLFVAESNLLQAKYDYAFKLKVLDYYRGMPLGF